jgi:transposase
LMKKKNISHKLIEQITGVDKTNIEKMYKRWKDRSSFLDARRSGRPSLFDVNQREELKKILEENRSASATDIKRIWNETCFFPLSLRFIQNVLNRLMTKKFELKITQKI